MNPPWAQFRRLLLGSVIELLLEERVALDFQTVRIVFDEKSEFKVPRLDNYMRFSGSLTARLLSPLDETRRASIANRMRKAWPELLTVLDIPVGDRLAETRNDVRVEVRNEIMEIRFDLEAD